MVARINDTTPYPVSVTHIVSKNGDGRFSIGRIYVQTHTPVSRDYETSRIKLL